MSDEANPKTDAKNKPAAPAAPVSFKATAKSLTFYRGKLYAAGETYVVRPEDAEIVKSHYQGDHVAPATELLDPRAKKQADQVRALRAAQYESLNG